MEFLKTLDIKKVKGRYSPIVFNSGIVTISDLHKLNLKELKKPKNGLDFLIFTIKNREKGKKIKTNKQILLGKIIGKNSSDFISLVANNTIKSKINQENAYSKIKLIQYNLHKSLGTTSLVGIMENPILNRDNLIESAHILQNLTLDVRKLMQKIVNTHL